jgi:HK97 gp10 family phage protein
MARGEAVSIQVDGLRKLQSELRSLDRQLPKELRKINKDAADILRDEARRLAPIGPTERLRASIRSVAGSSSAAVKIGTPARVPYAAPLIWGHGSKGSPRPQGGYMVANKFVTKAMKNTTKEITRTYDRAIGKFVKRVL